VAWRTDRITREVDPETGRRIVEHDPIPGVTPALQAALFEFEAGVHGTTKAVIRENARIAGGTPPLTHKIAATKIPANLRKFYPAADSGE
jgi:hypothetical protein